MFVVCSVGIHLAILGVILFSPAREYIFERERSLKPEIIARDDRLEELMAEVRDRTVDRLEGRVALLAEGQDRMAGNFETINAHLQPFQQMQTATARDRFEQYAKSTVTLQKELLNVLQSSPETLDNWNSLEANARQIAARLLSAQEEIRRGMMLLGHLDEELQGRQVEAEKQQFRVGQTLRELAEALSDEEKRLAQLEQDEATLEKLNQQIAELSDQLSPVEQELAEAKAEEEKLLAEPDETDARKKRAQNGQRNGARRHLIGTGRKASAIRFEIKRVTNGKDHRVESIASAKKRLEFLALRKPELLGESLERQLAATKLQSSVIDQIQTSAASSTPAPLPLGEL